MNLNHARRLALSLPEVTEQPHHDLASFRVRKRIFATISIDQLHLHIFVDEEMREQALALYPEAIEKLWWGAKVVGVRVQLARLDASVLRNLLLAAWQRKAPKELADKRVR